MKINRPIITHTLIKLTFSEQQVIKYINHYKKHIFDLSQKELSKLTYTSEATISRLVKKLNYKNYKDFSIKINQTISELNTKYLMHNNLSSTNIAKNIINTHLYAVTNGIDDYIIDSIMELSKSISKSKGRIIIFGLGTSNKTAKEFAVNLQRIGINALFSEDFHLLLPLLSLLNDNDKIILLSHSSENREINFTLNQAKITNAESILITGNGNPSIKPTKLIHYKIIHNDEYEIPISPKIIQSVICDIILQTILNSNIKYKNNMQKSSKLLSKWRRINL